VIQAFLPLLKQSEAGRIVNVSSELGSLTQNTNPAFEFRHIKLLAYNSSKTALNAVTLQFAHELHDTPIKVNAADPGYTATDFNNHRGTQTVEQGARAVVQLANGPGEWSDRRVLQRRRTVAVVTRHVPFRTQGQTPLAGGCDGALDDAGLGCPPDARSATGHAMRAMRSVDPNFQHRQGADHGRPLTRTC
jgi:NAD(P)-dependent dehydrogenase (short-subunit alcohol dehydrogenase family)